MAASRPDFSQPHPDREIILTRTYQAPRELVFDVYTDPRHIDQWWGPDGFTNRTKEMSVREGGRWVFDMLAPDGKVWPNRIVYLEVKRPERLVFEHGSDVDDDPDAFHVMVTFEEVPGGTRLTQRMVLKSKEACEHARGFGAVELGHQTLRKLEEQLARQR